VNHSNDRVYGEDIERLIIIQTQILKNLGYLVKKKRAKEKRKKRLRRLFVLLCQAFIMPFASVLSYIIPKKRKSILFMGRDKSGFMDNQKYLYLYLYENGFNEKYDLCFAGCRDDSVAELNKMGFKTVNFPSFKAYWSLLRAGLIVTDNAHWTTRNRSHFAKNTPTVQMWHGIGFKKIRLSDDEFVKKSKGLRGFLRYRVTGQLVKYDTFISTTKYFSDTVFSKSFEINEIVEIGYPRNDVFLDKYKYDENNIMLNVDKVIYNKIKDLKSGGKKVVLYAPTFRHAKKYTVSKQQVDYGRLNEFAKENNIYIVLKLHPLLKHMPQYDGYTNILQCDSRSDIYPMFRYFDGLITDYSSIYLDFLLLDRPIFFFQYDLEFYTSTCRDINPEHLNLSPGEKCTEQSRLEQTLYDTLVLDKDDWADERERVRELSWGDCKGDSSRQVWTYIENKYFKSRS
jgi:CDP-glycerol glycerophosphotransferase (TagB/SpsB family)